VNLGVSHVTAFCDSQYLAKCLSETKTLQGKLGMMVCGYNPSTPKAEAGELQD
jgi:hypothetical protein